MRFSAPKPARLAAAFFFLLILAAAGRNLVTVWHQVETAPRPPQWDMASRGVAGVRLAEDLMRGDVAAFLGRLNEMAVWPPFFPLLETPFILAFGAEYEVPRKLVGGLFLLAVLALFWAGRRLDPAHGDATGLLAAALLCASPHLHLFASLIMLEVPGLLLLTVCLATYGGALQRPSAARWRLAALAATLLFFTKYNYGLMWIVPVMLHEAWRSAGSWRTLLRQTGRALARLELRQPWNLFVLLYLGLTAVVVATGGIDTEVAGLPLRMSSLGGPIYALYVLTLLRLALHRPSRERLRAAYARLTRRRRIFAAWTGLPIALWMLVPDHTRNFFSFLGNRSSGIPLTSLESLAFYPRVFTSEYVTAPWIGGLMLVLALPCLALAFVAPARARSAPGEGARILALALLCGIVALLVHPYKLPRFLATTAPLLGLAAGLVGARILAVLAHLLVGRTRPSPGSRLVALLLAGLVAILLAAEPVDPERLRQNRMLHTVPRGAVTILEHLADAVREEPQSAVLGTWNLLSPALLEWHFHLHHPELPGSELSRASRELTNVALSGDSSATLCDAVTFRRVIALEPLPPEAWKNPRREPPLIWGFAEEIAPLAPVYAALETAPCFRLVEEMEFNAGGYRLRIFDRHQGTAPPPSPADRDEDLPRPSP